MSKKTPRPRHPSDDARLKRRPHVTVDLTARSHRKIGPAFAEPAARGVVLGLWILGRESWATATGDIVTLTHADLAWATGRERRGPALQELVRVCRMVGYRVWIHPKGEPLPHWSDLRSDLEASPCQPGTDPARTWHGPGASPVPTPCEAGASVVRAPHDFGAVSVHIRNLAKRQNLASAPRGPTPHDSAPQEQAQEQAQEQGKTRADSARPSGSQPPGDPLSEVWPEVESAFVAYLPDSRPPQLTDRRRKPARARLRDHPDEPPTILVEAIHGRMRQHQVSDYDPREHLTPESVFQASKFWRDVEACRNAVARGESPPFPYRGPAKRSSERTMSDRVRDITEGKFL